MNNKIINIKYFIIIYYVTDVLSYVLVTIFGDGPYFKRIISESFSLVFVSVFQCIYVIIIYRISYMAIKLFEKKYLANS